MDWARKFFLKIHFLKERSIANAVFLKFKESTIQNDAKSYIYAFQPLMDLPAFHRRAKRNKAGLVQFLKKLEEIVPEDFAPIVAETDKRVWEQIDCTKCANCCKKMTPTYSKADMVRIAAHFGLSVKAFKEKWLLQDEGSKDWVNTQTPCQFLAADNRCSIYEIRPLDCAEFPHHNKLPFDEYTETYIGNIDRCPATNLLVEKLKKRVERDYEW